MAGISIADRTCVTKNCQSRKVDRGFRTFCLLVMNLPIEHIIAAILGFDSFFFFLTGESRIVKPAWVVVKHGDLLGNVLFTDWFIGAKRREWMGCWGLLGVAGMIITSDYGSFPKIPCV